MDKHFLAEPSRRTLVGVQRDVIGALIIRELHTRFGRDNIGLLWLLVEPMMLAAAVTLIHYAGAGHTDRGMSPAAFTIVGYTPFLMFRSIIGRSEAAIESNRSLIYHRWVTLLDMLVARAILDFCAVTFAVFFLLTGAAIFGYGTLPVRPLVFFEGLGLLLWFSFSTGLLVAAASERSPVFARLVHPVMYISMPLSGAFFSLAWFPRHLGDLLSWFPLTDIFEIIRLGQFADYPDRYADATYVVACCMPLTLLGLISLTVVRRHININ